jgi:dTDP-4-amino-4,6-dideoxygalactose transaminase
MQSILQVPYHRASIGDEEINEVVRTLKSGWLTTGPRTAQFEQEFSTYADVPHALAVNSCTSGLHLALEALKIGPGMEVITTPLTFCATVNTIIHTGATPVLADVGPDGNIDPASIASRITDNTRAIVPVHFAGLPCDMDAIWRLARQHGLDVVEDCAHAAGALYKGRHAGAASLVTGERSAASVFSFYAVKNVTTGEGGMVLTHDEELASRMKILSLHGISKNAWNRYADRGHWGYEVLTSGYKYNMSDIQASIGIHQLKKLEGFIEARRRFAELYNELLADVEEVELPADRDDCRHAWHLYTLRLNLENLTIGRDEFIEELKDRGVGTSVHFIPIPLHPFFADYANLRQNQCPRALELYPRLISLPLFPAMTEQQVQYVAKAIKEIAWQSRKRNWVVMAVAGDR